MSTALYDICDLCGRREDESKGVFLHRLSGYAGYGSKYDEEYVSLHLCSECLDKMLDKPHIKHAQRRE